MIQKIKENLLRALTHPETAMAAKDAEELLQQIESGKFTFLDYTNNNETVWFEHVKTIAHLAGNHDVRSTTESVDILLKAVTVFLECSLTVKTTWYQQVGFPRYLARIYLLLEENLTATQKETILSYVKNGSVSACTTLYQDWIGTNLLWVLMNNIMYGIITNDFSAVPQGVQQVQKEFVCHENGEPGIQPLYGFIPYPNQFYINESPYTFTNECAYLIFTLQGTDYQFEIPSLGVLGFYYVFGLRYEIRNQYCSYLTMGKNLATPDAMHTESIRKAMWLFLNVEEMPCRDVMQEQFASLSYEMYSVKNDKYLPSTKSYISRRVTSHISCHGTAPDLSIDKNNCLEDGISANFYAGGATCIMTNGKEYENIFPLWDFAHIPGTTTTTKVHKAFNNVENTYCGGYCHNEVGAMYQDINFDEVTGVTARFFIDGMMIALGANISSQSDLPVNTTLNQCRHNDEVQQHENAYYHGNVVYASLDDNQIIVDTKEKTGNWSTLNAAINKEETAEITTFYIDHGVAPKNATYAYAVLPAVAKGNANDALQTLYKNIKILQNDGNIQAIQYKNKVYCVFHKDDSLRLSRVDHYIGTAHTVHVFEN